MKPSRPKPSLLRILWTDYPAFYGWLVVVVVWIVYAAWAPAWSSSGAVIKPQAQPFFLAGAVVVSAVGLCLTSWRSWLIFKTFRFGMEIKGKITHFELKRDRGRVEYVYIFDHKEHFSGVGVHRNARTKAIKSGDHVILVVDRSKPTRAYIRDLYTRS